MYNLIVGTSLLRVWVICSRDFGWLDKFCDRLKLSRFLDMIVESAEVGLQVVINCMLSCLTSVRVIWLIILICLIYSPSLARMLHSCTCFFVFC